jgi:hypothetical protein
MRDQYAGDISDLLKFAFLRALAGTDRVLGVAWYYDEGHDRRTDGQHVEWRGERAWQKLDADLHRALSNLPERSVAALEQLAIWPARTFFHRAQVAQGAARTAWANHKRSSLLGADLIFLDPDNGLSQRMSRKHATFEEVEALRQPGRAIVFITFPGRTKPHPELLTDLHERLRIRAQVGFAMTLRTSVAVPSRNGGRIPRIRWFTVVDPDRILVERVHRFSRHLAALPGVRVHVD